MPEDELSTIPETFYAAAELDAPLEAREERADDESLAEDETGYSDLDDAEEEPAEESAGDVGVRPGDRPPPYVQDLSLAEKSAIGQLFSENPADAVSRIVQSELRQAAAAREASDYHLNHFSAQAPDYFRTHRSTISRVLSEFSPATRSGRDASIIAALVPIYEEVRQTGDVRGAVIRAARLMSGAASNGSRPAPPNHRMPLPGVNPGAARGGGQVRPAPGRSSGDAVAERLIRTLGISPGLAKRMLEDL